MMGNPSNVLILSDSDRSLLDEISALKGDALTYDQLTDKQKQELSLTWDKLTDAQKTELADIYEQAEEAKFNSAVSTAVSDINSNFAAVIKKADADIEELTASAKLAIATANSSADKADQAADNATAGAEKIGETIRKSEAATAKVLNLVSDAEQATAAARDAADAANAAKASANTSAANANAATASATTAAATANNSAAKADAAAASAGTAASAANTATANANTATGKANAAATSATAATTAANEGASRANAASEVAERYAKALIHGQSEGTVAQCEMSAELPLQEVRVEGATSQNLFPMMESRSVNGISYVINEDGSFTASGTSDNWAQTFTKNLSNIVAGKTYTLIASNSDQTVRAVIRAFNSESKRIMEIWSTPQGTTFTVPSDAVKVITFVTTNENTTISTTTIYPMLVEGTEAKPFTPCAKITNVEGEVELVRTGKNLCAIDITAISKSSAAEWSIAPKWSQGDSYVRASFQIEGGIFPSTTYTIANRLLASMYIAVWETNSNGNMLYDSGWITSETKTFTTTPGTTKLRIAMRLKTDGTFDYNTLISMINYIQLELGDTATDYEPYQSTTTTITLPEGEFMGQLPDGTADYIEVKDGVGTLVKNIGHDTITSKSTPSYYMFSDKGGNVQYVVNNNVVKGDRFMSENYKVGPAAGNWSLYNNSVAVGGSVAPYCVQFSTSMTTLEDFSASLGDGVSVYYPCEPYTVSLGSIDLLDGVYGITNVYASNAQNLSQTVEVEYIQDSTLVIDELRAAIVAND